MNWLRSYPVRLSFLAALLLALLGILLANAAVWSAIQLSAISNQVNQESSPLDQPLCDPPNFDVPGGFTCTGPASNDSNSATPYTIVAWVTGTGSLCAFVSGAVVYKHYSRQGIRSHKP